MVTDSPQSSTRQQTILWVVLGQMAELLRLLIFLHLSLIILFTEEYLIKVLFGFMKQVRSWLSNCHTSQWIEHPSWFNPEVVAENTTVNRLYSEMVWGASVCMCATLCFYLLETFAAWQLQGLNRVTTEWVPIMVQPCPWYWLL